MGGKDEGWGQRSPRGIPFTGGWERGITIGSQDWKLLQFQSNDVPAPKHPSHPRSSAASPDLALGNGWMRCASDRLIGPRRRGSRGAVVLGGL